MFRTLTTILLVSTTVACGLPSHPVDGNQVRRDNSPPTLAGAAITEGSYQKESVITVTPRGWNDADGDPEWYRYQWYADGAPIAGQTFASLSGEHFDKGSVIYCQVTPVDAFDAGLSVNSNSVTIGNTPPALRAAAFSVDAPTSNDDLTLVPIDAYDPDTEPVVYSVAWYVNETPVTDVTGLTLPRKHYRRGDSVYAVITPHDGETPGATFSTEPVIIQNALPTITAALLSAGPHDKRHPIGALADAEDADADLLTYAFRWYVNGTSVATVSGSLLPTSAFKRGDTVWFEVRAHDGLAFGNWTASGSTTVQNAPPASPSASLYPAAVSTSDPIWVAAAANSDPDGDTVTLTYAWYKNDVLQEFPATLTAVVSNTVTYYTRPGDTWRAAVIASDGVAATTAYSEGLTVQKVRFREASGDGWPYPNDQWSRACALDTRGSLWCWGLDGRRQLSPWGYAVTPATLRRFGEDWKTLGTHGRCAIRTDGTLWCWNFRAPGEPAATQIGIENDWVGVFESPFGGMWGNLENTCALKSNHELWCWGSNASGSAGFGLTGFIPAPAELTAATGWKKAALSSAHGCGVTEAGALWCWGEVTYGRLGIEGASCSLWDCYWYPTKVTSAVPWNDVAVSKNATCAIKNDGTLWCWGLQDITNANPVAGDSAWDVPTKVGAADNWVAIEGAQANFCALNVEGAVYCWGSNYYGALGIGLTDGPDNSCTITPCSFVPSKVNHAGAFVTINHQGSKVCGIDEDGILWCWGSNEAAGLGVGTPLGTGTPEDYALSGPEFCGGADQVWCSTVPREVYQ